jgi:hypothetical protein
VPGRCVTALTAHCVLQYICRITACTGHTDKQRTSSYQVTSCTPKPMVTIQLSADNVLQMSIPVAARSKAWVCGRSFPGIVGSNPAGGGMDVCCECCVLSGLYLVGLIFHPEESYRVWRVWIWSWSLDNEDNLDSRGCSAMENVLQIAVQTISNCSNTTKYSLVFLLILDRWRCSLQLSYRTSDAANTISHYSSSTQHQTLLTSSHITAILQNIRRC